MTDLDIECQYRLEERLGILCGAQRPLPAELAIATHEVAGYRADAERQALMDRIQQQSRSNRRNAYLEKRFKPAQTYA